MLIPFEKWHGCKNDFILIWITETEGDIFLDVVKRKAPWLCSKNGDGVGADGVLVLHHKRKEDPHVDRVTIINSDGSIAQNCGNGLRCATASVLKRMDQLMVEHPQSMELGVGNSKVICSVLQGASELRIPHIAVEMPDVLVDSQIPEYPELKKECEELLKKFPMQQEQFFLVDVGNPHLVLFGAHGDKQKMLQFGKEAQKMRKGDGINVHFATQKELTAKDTALAKNVLGEQIVELYDVFVWERGVGPTPACGTGACAVAAAVYQQGMTERTGWIGIDMPGGRLYVRQPTEDDSVRLAGPSEFVFAGQLDL